MVQCHELAVLKPDSGGLPSSCSLSSFFKFLLLVVCLAFPQRALCEEKTAIREILFSAEQSSVSAVAGPSSKAWDCLEDSLGRGCCCGFLCEAGKCGSAHHHHARGLALALQQGLVCCPDLKLLSELLMVIWVDVVNRKACLPFCSALGRSFSNLDLVVYVYIFLSRGVHYFSHLGIHFLLLFLFLFS